MHAPQIIWIFLSGIELGIYMVKNGQPKGDYDLGIYLVAAVVNVGLLYWGGFFSQP